MARLSLSTTGKVTLISVFLYAIILTVLEILVVNFHHGYVNQFKLDHRGTGVSEADLIYHTIFILSLAFQVILCVDALWRKNSMQLVALVLFNLLSLAYAGVQLYQHTILETEGTETAEFSPEDSNMFPTREDAGKFFIERMRPLEYVIISIVGVFSGYLGALSYKLTKEFGWEIYKSYSADVETRNAFRSLSILQTLTKLDIFFIGTYAIQLIPSLSIGYSTDLVETLLIFLIGTMMMLAAWYSIVKENKYLLLGVINVLTLSLAYMVYRLVKVNIPQSDGDPYEFTRRLLTFSLATTFCLVLATIFYAVICFRNMMRGIYIFSVYGLPGQEQKVPEIQQSNQTGFNSEYLGYDGYSGHDTTDESKRRSKRASKMAEVKNARLSRRESID